jgi:hypothetical protein
MTERMAERDDPFRNGERAESPNPLSPVLPVEWERPSWSRAPDTRWEQDSDEDTEANEHPSGEERRRPSGETGASDETIGDQPSGDSLTDPEELTGRARD